MKIEHFKTYTNLHTWTGITTGLFLFICFTTGALTMFKEPLNQWALQKNATLAPIELHQYDELIQKVLQAHPEAQAEMSVYLPSVSSQHAPVSWEIHDPVNHSVTLWHATLNQEGDLVSEQASVSVVGDFMDHLHRTAGIPGGDGHDAVGTYFMGIVAALYFFALVSGVIIFLPSWFKDLFAWRKGKNRKRFWLDLHNILGISALPFHIVIAFTTVVFAYHDLFYSSLSTLVYKDTPLFAGQTPGPKDRNFNDLATIEALGKEIKELEPDFDLKVIMYRGLNTPRALALVGGEMQGHWIRGPYYVFVGSDAYTAAPGYTVMLPNSSGIMAKVVNGFFALHFGSFGGNLIRWVYFLLAIAGAVLFLSGNILWLEKRKKRHKSSLENTASSKSSAVLARLTIGVCLGTLVGIVLSLLFVFWLPHHLLDIAWWQKAAYYSGFLLCILWSFVQTPIRVAVKQLQVLILLCGVLLVSCLLRLFQSSDLASVDIILPCVVSIFLVAFIFTLKYVRQRALSMVYSIFW